ncbi:MAG: hypothetical protein A2498_13875 [Lentisphaerae bacterium RIFOXYC12_FULL_60_16]|nr:MAG: hypothetical protein A2498_13875 [Lentisphaerae bacterium RIFOXYC12_FULL_60_16]OGV73637.1 MAG: hypothetical protein A2269_01845 [Lentisphaerae bacterium RIFOXYA12_FULL_60_10]OGV80387.1 MAG: hypothetical protein A2340_10285 [Lentisphaerae bacterium RIFOXYB12_FULL_60_10]
MTPASRDIPSPIRSLIEAAGHFTQSLGLGRVLGQIYAFLYFTPHPRTLDDLTHALGISKGSASMGVRQLAQWGALEPVWVKGDRKDYYRARDNFGRILKNILQDMAGKRLEASAMALTEAEHAIHPHPSPGIDPDSEAFIQQRLETLRAFQHKIQSAWGSFAVGFLSK